MDIETCRCPCGNPDCGTEALPERCTFRDHRPLPGTVDDENQRETIDAVALERLDLHPLRSRMGRLRIRLHLSRVSGV